MQETKEQYNKAILPEMKKKFGYTNDLAVPRITKIVVSVGTGSFTDTEKKKNAEKAIGLISGQKPKMNVAKKSIAAFKLREGMPVGYSTTLRGTRMNQFLNKLINVAIPRIRDFRGIDPKIVDDKGNMTLGFREHIVFPETSREDVRKAFGLGVTVATSANSKEEAVELFKLLGFPFKKEDKKVK